MMQQWYSYTMNKTLFSVVGVRFFVQDFYCKVLNVSTNTFCTIYLLFNGHHCFKLKTFWSWYDHFSKLGKASRWAQADLLQNAHFLSQNPLIRQIINELWGSNKWHDLSFESCCLALSISGMVFENPGASNHRMRNSRAILHFNLKNWTDDL